MLHKAVWRKGNPMHNYNFQGYFNDNTFFGYENNKIERDSVCRCSFKDADTQIVTNKGHIITEIDNL